MLLQHSSHLLLVRHRGAGLDWGSVQYVGLLLELRVVVTNVRQVLEPDVMLLPGVLLRFVGGQGKGVSELKEDGGPTTTDLEVNNCARRGGGSFVNRENRRSRRRTESCVNVVSQ